MYRNTLYLHYKDRYIVYTVLLRIQDAHFTHFFPRWKFEVGLKFHECETF
jgi:hypothetical protein